MTTRGPRFTSARRDGSFKQPQGRGFEHRTVKVAGQRPRVVLKQALAELRFNVDWSAVRRELQREAKSCPLSKTGWPHGKELRFIFDDMPKILIGDWKQFRREHGELEIRNVLGADHFRIICSNSVASLSEHSRRSSEVGPEVRTILPDTIFELIFVLSLLPLNCAKPS